MPGSWKTEEVILIGTRYTLRHEIKYTANVKMEEVVDVIGTIEVGADIITALLVKIKASVKGEFKRHISALASAGVTETFGKELERWIDGDSENVIARRYMVAPIYDAFEISIGMRCSACRQEAVHALRVLIPTGEWMRRIEETHRDGSQRSWEI